MIGLVDKLYWKYKNLIEVDNEIRLVDVILEGNEGLSQEELAALMEGGTREELIDERLKIMTEIHQLLEGS